MKIETYNDEVAFMGPFPLNYVSNFKGYEIWQAVATGALYIVDQTTLEVVRGIQLKDNKMEIL